MNLQQSQPVQAADGVVVPFRMPPDSHLHIVRDTVWKLTPLGSICDNSTYDRSGDKDCLHKLRSLRSSLILGPVPLGADVDCRTPYPTMAQVLEYARTGTALLTTQPLFATAIQAWTRSDMGVDDLKDVVCRGHVYSSTDGPKQWGDMKAKAAVEAVTATEAFEVISTKSVPVELRAAQTRPYDTMRQVQDIQRHEVAASAMLSKTPDPHLLEAADALLSSALRGSVKLPK